MKRTIPLWLLASLFLITGCQSSLQSMKPDATLLVIPLANEREVGVNPFGSYYAVITDRTSDKDRAVVRLSPSEEYALGKKIPAGDYYISQSYFQFTEDKEIPDSERKFYEEDYAPFTMETGKITLCPVVFSTRTTKGNKFMTTNMDLSSFKDKNSLRGGEILKLLKAKYPKEYDTWEIRE